MAKKQIKVDPLWTGQELIDLSRPELEVLGMVRKMPVGVLAASLTAHQDRLVKKLMARGLVVYERCAVCAKCQGGAVCARLKVRAVTAKG